MGGGTGREETGSLQNFLADGEELLMTEPKVGGIEHFLVDRRRAGKLPSLAFMLFFLGIFQQNYNLISGNIIIVV